MSKKVQQKFTATDVKISKAFEVSKGKPLTFKQINAILEELGLEPINSGHLNSAMKKGIIKSGDEVMQTVTVATKVTAYRFGNFDADLAAAKCSDEAKKVAEAIKTMVEDEDIKTCGYFTAADVSAVLGKKVAPAHLTKLCGAGFITKDDEKVAIKRLREEPAKSYERLDLAVVEGEVVPTSVELEVEDDAE